MLKAASGNVHLVGCCGVGMSGLAFHLAARGLRVTGCDSSPGRLSPWLRRHGVPVARGHDPSHLRKMDWVVRSAAASVLMPEIAAAAASRIPVFRRGAVLAALLRDRESVIVSGTHGKTTTSAMIVHVLMADGRMPDFCIGGELPALGGVAGAGNSGLMVAEADESDGTLACYAPDIAVVTNMEFDHAEHFKSSAEMRACFDAMVHSTRKCLVYCADDQGARLLCARRKGAMSYGFSRKSDLRASHHVADGSGSRFTVSLHGRRLGEFCLPVPGRHNVLNSLAACGAALALGIPFHSVKRGLAGFRPVRRRFERVVDRDDIFVLSDYAHHPTEIAALIKGASLLGRRRLVAVFQPHRFSRTLALGEDFPKAFNGVERVVLVPVYAASEQPVEGGSVWDLYARFREAGRVNALCAKSLRTAWNYLELELRTGDGLLVVGAGDVERIAGWAGARFAGAGPGENDPVCARARELEGLGLHATAMRTREPMAGKTTLHVGGQADIFLDVASEEDLASIMKWSARRGVPVKIIGAGSNVLVGDPGVRGVVIRLSRRGFGSVRMDGGNRVVGGAAAGLSVLVARLAARRKKGLLFLAGIPGTVGGALRMNAGAWGRSIGERVVHVRVMEMDGSVRVLERKDMRFAYRNCGTLRSRVALDAVFRVESGDAREIAEELESISARRAWMKGLRSAGSVFKNPPGDFAGRLIERSGLKGHKVGGACVSDRHANCIVTGQGATASDVMALVEIVRGRVKSQFGIDLVEEVVRFE